MTDLTLSAALKHLRMTPRNATPPPQPPPRDIQPPPLPAATVAAGPVVDSIEGRSLLTDMLSQLPSWLISMSVHLVLVIALALGVVNAHHDGTGDGDSDGSQYDAPVAMESSAPELDKPETIDIAIKPETAIEPLPVEEVLQPIEQEQVLDSLTPLVSSSTIAKIDAGLTENGGSGPAGEPGGPGGTVDLAIGNNPSDMLKGRLNEATRAALVERDGGSPESEAAVGRALKWLSLHQMTDGGWNFDHTQSPKCRGKCDHPGAMGQARIAATAFALLPFLGQGHTHKGAGPYKLTIERGLYFLTRSMQMSGSAGSLHEPAGRMYGHGLASIVLCEAFGLTHDSTLHQPAQASLNFIVLAQDPGGGGWRYFPQQPGDTSVVGWQLMALKSGHMAYLQVPPQTIKRAGDFLDEVQDNDGASYGYTGPGARPSMTAIGLLCRLYLGWETTDARIQTGVRMLENVGPSTDKKGPDRNNMYYNYYATQLMHHVGGYPWQQWNKIMRDYLVKCQARHGHSAGSWQFEGDDLGNSPGGRLYNTAMATMILEVYYRHMPLYQKQSLRDDFGR
jgi:hypothetical protein